MFVSPTLISGLGRSSNWKNLKESSFFCLQQRHQQKPRNVPQYRIIFKSFPHFRVAYNDDYAQINEAFEILHNEVLPGVEGKKTSKKIMKQLKVWCEEKTSLPPFDEDGYVSDTSVTPEDGNSSGEMGDRDDRQYDLSSKGDRNGTLSSLSSRKSNEGAEKTTLDDGERIPTENSDSESSNGDSSSMEGGDAETDGRNNALEAPDNWVAIGNSVVEYMMGWIEGPSTELSSQQLPKNSSNSTNKPTLNNNKNASITDIPLQFIDLLTYPEIDPSASKKASFAVLREVSFVRQRRRVLFALTVFMILIRYCSFDLFLVLLFAANCGMLFLMKNSGRVNVTMAKRAVRQRIGWAKQWAGSLLRKRSSNTGGNNNNNNNNNNSGVNSGPGNSNGNVKATPTAPTPVKIIPQESLQSGSLSDTTYGGSVTSKINTRRGGFFRNRNNQSSAGAPKSSQFAEMSALNAPNHNNSKISVASTTTTSNAPLLPSVNASNQSLISNSTIATATTLSDTVTNSTGSTPRRRFFKGRSNTSSLTTSTNQGNTSSSVAPSLPSLPVMPSLTSTESTEKITTTPPSTVTTFLDNEGTSSGSISSKFGNNPGASSGSHVSFQNITIPNQAQSSGVTKSIGHRRNLSTGNAFSTLNRTDLSVSIDQS